MGYFCRDASLAESHCAQGTALSEDSHTHLRQYCALPSAEPLSHSDTQQVNQPAVETLEGLNVPGELSPLASVSYRTAKGRKL